MKIFTIFFLLFSIISCTKDNKIKSASGVIELSPQLTQKLSPEAVLFIIARQAGETSGPPVAVRRFVQPLKFPFEFSLTEQDRMIPNTRFEGQISITARIAQSGSATPVQAGDIEGTGQPPTVSVGEKNIKIILDHIH